MTTFGYERVVTSLPFCKVAAYLLLEGKILSLALLKTFTRVTLIRLESVKT